MTKLKRPTAMELLCPGRPVMGIELAGPTVGM
jgi:hypothetical protein